MPPGNWLSSFLVAVLAAGLIVGGYEAYWRNRGFQPRVQDDARLWAAARAEVRGDSLVLLGTSRIRSDIEPKLLARLTGRSVVQLAIPLSDPLPILESLAADPGFHGTVLYDMVPALAFDPTREPEKISLEYMQAFRQRSVSPSEMSEEILERHLLQHTVFRLPELSHLYLVKTLLSERRAPDPPWVFVRADRAMPLDFQIRPPDPPPIEPRALKPGPTDRQMAETLQRFQRAVEALDARGARIVFIHFPQTDKERSDGYPRELYWDRFAREIAAPNLRCDEEPSLAGFRCPDESHLDFRDAPAFTRELVNVLKSRDIL